MVRSDPTKHERDARACTSYWKVLQDEIVPFWKPRWNHSVRWAELPWVKVSGLTVPRVMRWMRSSPTAAAAFRPESTSPGSSRLRSWVECPQTPAKQSACSSRRTESWLACLRILLLCRAHLAFDAQQFLDVMSDFVGQDVGFGEFSGRAEALLQFVVEAEIDVNLFVLGTVERAGGGLRRAAGGIVVVAKQDQLGVAVGNTLLRQDLAPGVLGVVQDEGDEIDQRLFLLVAGGIGLADRGAGVPMEPLLTSDRKSRLKIRLRMNRTTMPPSPR